MSRADFKSQVQKLHWATLGLCAVLAVAVLSMLKDISFGLFVTHLTRDELASQTGTVFAPAGHHFIDLSLRVALLTVLGLSALFALLKVAWYRQKYEDQVEAGVAPMRWLGIGLTSALLIEIVAMFSGVLDVLMLKVLAGAMLLTALLSWVAEKQNKGARKPVWSAYNLSYLSGFLPWLVILGSAIFTPIYGMVRAPWYVYALYAVTFIGFHLYAWNQRREYKRPRTQQDNWALERNYALVHLVLVTVFTAVLLAGLQR